MAVVFAVSLVYLNRVYFFLTIAFVLAYLLDPIVEYLYKRGLPRAWGSLLTLFVFFLTLAAAGVVIIPKILAQGQELLERLPRVYAALAGILGPVSQKYLGYNVLRDVDQLIADIGNPAALAKPIGAIVGGFFATTFHFVTTILGLLIIPLMAFYLMKDFPYLHGKFLTVVPGRHHKDVTELRRRLHTVFGGFIRGQLVVSTVLSVYYCTAFALTGIDLALVLGLMAGFFNIIPYLGILSVVVLTGLIALVHASGVGTYVALAVIFAVGMGAEGAVLTPRIVGRKVGLSPLTLILALLVGGELLGLVGMLLAVPLAAILKVFLDMGLDRYRKSEVFNRA